MPNDDLSSHPAEQEVADAIPAAMPPMWATKGIEFWTLFSCILLRTQPESLLEFGGGRSSTYMADYAARSRKPFVCIEQSDIWANKIRSDLKFMDIPQGSVKHAPTVKMDRGPDWYDPAVVKAAIGDRAFDLVFVDGPSGGGRNSPIGCDIILRAARSARLQFVDDVQRPVCLKFFDRMAARVDPAAHFYFIYRRQAIAFASAEFAETIAACFDFLGLKRAERAEVDVLAADPANA